MNAQHTKAAAVVADPRQQAIAANWPSVNTLSAPLVRDLGSGWRSGRFDDVLAGDFDLIARNR